MEAQVALTQHQITATQLQIQQLGGEIQDAQQTIATEQVALERKSADPAKDRGPAAFDTVAFIGRHFAGMERHERDPAGAETIRNKMETLQAQESNLADSQTASKQKQATLAAQQQALASQQQSLVATVQSKSQLLSETNAKESNYEKLLAAAEAELASFSAFAQNAGGSKLLGSQTVCDAWGCYYNQRDATWGNIPLDGTQYKLASDGCLVTSMAMVMTHYGYHDVRR